MSRRPAQYTEQSCPQCEGTGVFAQGLGCLRCDATGKVYARQLLQTPQAIAARERTRRKSLERRNKVTELRGQWAPAHADVIDRIYRVDNDFTCSLRQYFERKGCLTPSQVDAVRRG